MDQEEAERALAEVEATASVYQDTSAAHKAAMEAALTSALRALRLGIGPEAVAKKSPFTAAYLRRKARAANIPAPEAYKYRNRRQS